VDNYSKKPPVIAAWILKHILPAYDSEYLLNDYEYLYHSLLREKGKYSACFWYWCQLLISFFPFLKHSLYWGTVMFKSYFKTALRNIKRQKGYSFINIMGLAIGMACCILMLLWVQDEISYDKFHDNFDYLYRVTVEETTGDKITHMPSAPYPLGPSLQNDYPEVIDYCRYTGGYTGWNLQYNNKSFSSERIAFGDPSFFKMFSFPLIKGDPESALAERFSVVISEDLAGKVFGDEEPMGKVMQMSGRDLKVTGVMRKIPRNSHMQFDYILPVINQTQWRGQDFQSWRQGCTLYIRLEKGSRISEVSSKIADITAKYTDEISAAVYLQPMKRIHLYSQFVWDGENVGRGDITYVYIFTLTALGVLLIACINFMNLSTARSGSRAKEVGMRKVAGAQRKDLVKQFFGESVLLSFFALVFAILFAFLFLPTFNSLSGKQLSLNFTDNILILIGLAVIALVTGIVSGCYPALFLSSFQPVRVLKGIVNIKTGRQSPLRKFLVVLQFTITIILIISTTVIFTQISFMRNKDLGFDKDCIVSFAGYGRYGGAFDEARSELLKNPDILNACKAFPPTGGARGITDFTWEGKDPQDEIALHPIPVGYDYIETFTMKMVEGRSFSREFSSDTLNCIINETAVRVMGIDNPVGKRISYAGNMGRIYGFNNNEGIITGVVKDFQTGSLHNEIVPTVLKFSPMGFFVIVKMNPEKVSEAIAFLEDKWKEFVPGRPFRYTFLDESIEDFYTGEKRIATIFRYFTILAVLIASLGLFGLASFMAEQRTKEIGIRKVLGASIAKITILFSTEFIKWILIANIIAWPTAYFIMRNWLQNFAYCIDLGFGIFLFSAVLALLIAVGTVIFQTMKAASANPIDSLRYE